MDLIKTERARNVIANLIGKCVHVKLDDCDEGECIASGIYGIGELCDMEQLCITFSKKTKYGCASDDEPACLQAYISDFETLLQKGEYNDGCISLKLI